jgi:hypothetical protein
MALAMVAAAADALALARMQLRQMVARSLLFCAITLPIHVWAAREHGLQGISMSLAGGWVLLTLLRLRMGSSLLGEPLLQPFITGWRALVATAAMGAAVVLSDAPSPMGRGEWQVLLDTVPRVLLGGLVYGGVLWALWRAQGRPDGLEARLLDAWPKARRKLGL